MKIEAVRAFHIFDSRGHPTVEAEIRLEGGAVGHGLVPSGASTGQYEALELRDGDAGRYRGLSVFRAISNIEGEIARRVRGRDANDQRGLDRALIELDGTPNKSRLGANALLAVSMATADAAAHAAGVPLFQHLGNGTLLPLPEIQIIGGGAHANWSTDVQDFLLTATGATSYEGALEITFSVFKAAGDLLRARGGYRGVADEGGYWPSFDRNEGALEFLVEAIRAAGYTPGREASLSLDIAASDLYDAPTRRYRFRMEGREFTSDEFVDLMTAWCERYPIVSIEDPMADVDWDGWEGINDSIGSRVQLVGDDLFTTNIGRIREGIRRGCANSVLIKLNQIGTVSETIAAIEETKAAGWAPVVSARSGETEDTFIAHLAVATEAGQLKVGSFCRSERMAKWNEIIRIGRRLGARARFNGAKSLARRGGVEPSA